MKDLRDLKDFDDTRCQRSHSTVWYPWDQPYVTTEGRGLLVAGVHGCRDKGVRCTSYRV